MLASQLALTMACHGPRMTDQEILTIAIEKAITGGWEGLPHVSAANYLAILKQRRTTKEEWYPVIFNHDFAKALWGGKRIGGAYTANGSHRALNHAQALAIWKLYDDFGWFAAWQVHLQQMVVADEPIKYLGEHLDERPDTRL